MEGERVERKVIICPTQSIKKIRLSEYKKIGETLIEETIEKVSSMEGSEVPHH